MKAVIVRYLNDIVSLTIMALMAVALIAGQADATVSDDVRGDAAFVITLDIKGDSTRLLRPRQAAGST